jgi:transposase
VEKAFDDLKNDLDMNRIRVQSSQRMQARFFIQFIALILLSRIRKTLREKLCNTGWTAKSVLMELETLTTIHYSGQYQSLRSEATKKQRSILEAFRANLLIMSQSQTCLFASGCVAVHLT